MDKYEYKVKLEQIEKMAAKKDYITAAKIADGIDWRKERSVATLSLIADVYEKANMAIGWIISTEKMPYYDDDSIKVNGLEYKKVRPDCHYGAHALEHHKKELGQTEKLIYDKKTLKAYISTLINPEEAQAYMEDARDLKKIVEDEAGYLYVLPFSYIPEGYGKENIRDNSSRGAESGF